MFSADLGGVTASSTPAATDPPFQKVALLLHGDGTNGAQNNTFVDSSTNNFTITRTGNVAQGTFSPFSLAEGQWSNYFDGSGDYLTVPASTALDFGTGDFTVEWWQYWNGTQSSYGTLYNNNYASGPNLTIQTNANANQYIVYMNGTSTTITESSAASANQWYHYAVVRNGTTVTIYRNGVSTGSTTYSGNVGSSVTTYIGTGGSGPFTITASYLSNFRIVKGTAVYTSNFTPPTSALTAITNTSLLTCQSNRFKDNSSNNFTITPSGDTKVTAFSPFEPGAPYIQSINGGSGYFDGSGDYLTVASNAAFDQNSSNWTIESWVYLTAPVNASNGTCVVGQETSNYLKLSIKNSGVAIIDQASAGVKVTGTTVLKLNTWYHLAAVRNSNTVTLFVNGISEGTPATITSYAASANTMYIAKRPDTADSLSGYISNLRIVKGTAVYTANFTPPTAPLTAVTNTQLLLNCTNAGIFDNAGKNDIETVGNAQISTSVKKYGTGSMYFDGTGDQLSAPGNAYLFNMGTGDFTVEAWVYHIPAFSVGTYRIIWQNYTSSNTSRMAFGFNGDKLGLFFNSTSVEIPTGSGYFSQNTWMHLAVTRQAGTVVLWVNGVARQAAINNTVNFNAADNCIVGGNWYGYIDDLRITKGQALYTSNFTPPTQAFPNV